MSLMARLNLYFISTLAIVLSSFSIALFLLARFYLHRQLDERLDATLNVLTAAIELTPEGVEWEPSDRQLVTRSNLSNDPIVWLVSDPAGRLVDHEGPTNTAEFALEIADRLHETREKGKRFDWENSRWQFRQVWVESSHPVTPVKEGDRERRYPALGITVGISLAPMQGTLQTLSGVLATLTTTIMLAGLLGGRVVCRHALRPVSTMAQAARAMDAAALNERLPIFPRGDELEDLARSFNGLLERVQESYERQQRFTGEASHQLRTPLAALLGQVEVALRRDRPVDEYKRVLDSVHQQAERLQRIVEALLFLARADSEARLPQSQEIDLANWIGQHLQRWSDNPRVADLRTATIPLHVNADSVLLGELLDILLSNAFKYSPAGTPVTLEIREEEGNAEISVTDQGYGIPEKDLPHVFKPFFRSSTARLMGIEGVGLGLAIAQRIASALGGSLSVKSQECAGSRFGLKLPLQKSRI